MNARLLALPLLGLALTGCVSTAKTIVTAPVKATGKVIDWTTTSQEEADRNRGRELRKREERVGKLERQRDKAAKRCHRGDREQCQRAQILNHEIEAEMAAPY